MKNLFSIFLLLLLSLPGFSQVSFSCTYREYCDWEPTEKIFQDCEGYSENSLFVMNESETMFTHTLNSMESTYYVKTKEYDAENEVFLYNVISDVGNKYLYIFDINNKQIRVLITLEDGSVQLLRFYAKAIF